MRILPMLMVRCRVRGEGRTLRGLRGPRGAGRGQRGAAAARDAAMHAHLRIHCWLGRDDVEVMILIGRSFFYYK